MDVDGKGFFIRVYQHASVVQSYVKHGWIVAWVVERALGTVPSVFWVKIGVWTSMKGL